MALSAQNSQNIMPSKSTLQSTIGICEKKMYCGGNKQNETVTINNSSICLCMGNPLT